MFYISTKGDLNFRIKLHSDDRNTLCYIQSLLSKLANRNVGVIVDSKKHKESYYSVDKLKDIHEILIPIFNKYYFTSFKYLDFIDFKTAAEIKKVAYLEKRKLNDQELLAILNLKSNMNTKRTEFNQKNLPKRPLTPYRLLGFLEGDGSFCLPNLIPSLVIKQHSKNIHFLFEISEFLSNLPFNPSIGPETDLLGSKPIPSVHDSKSTNLSSLTVSNILQIFNYVLPFLKSLKFKSRKAVDFIY